jgi:hypothetical protein
MPIRPEFRKFYGREWRNVIRPRILARAKNCCEECRVPNQCTVLRTFGWWTPATLEATVFKAGGRIHGRPITELVWHHAGVAAKLVGFPLGRTMHWVAIHLTVAHLNHTPGDDRDENLKALCSWCHLNYDKFQHHLTRAARKDAKRPLLQERDSMSA